MDTTELLSGYCVVPAAVIDPVDFAARLGV